MATREWNCGTQCEMWGVDEEEKAILQKGMTAWGKELAAKKKEREKMRVKGKRRKLKCETRLQRDILANADNVAEQAAAAKPSRQEVKQPHQSWRFRNNMMQIMTLTRMRTTPVRVVVAAATTVAEAATTAAAATIATAAVAAANRAVVVATRGPRSGRRIRFRRRRRSTRKRNPQYNSRLRATQARSDPQLPKVGSQRSDKWPLGITGNKVRWPAMG